MSVYSGQSGNPGMTRAGFGGDQPWHRWQDWVNLILGIALFVAPWTWRTGPVTTAMSSVNSNAWICGAIIAIVALCALASPRSIWTEWVNTIVGIWLFISPWVLGFTASMMGTQNGTCWFIGFVVAVLSIWAGAQVGGSRTATTA